MKKICKECNNAITGEFVEIDGEYVCQECFDEIYFYCEDCGKIEKRDYGYWVEDAEKLVCGNCIENYYYCEDCNNYFEYATYITDYGYVCESCFDRNCYGYCDSCDRYFTETYYSERHDAYFCESCYEESDDGLYDYHEFDDWQLFKGKNEVDAPYYIGKEIELEPKSYNCVNEVVETINNHINAVGMYDGSLSEGGVEVVTHPESWEYLQEHKEDYKNFFSNIEHLNYGDDGNAGLHFHVTRPNDNVIARVIILMESFKEEIKKLSRRSEGQLSSWAKFYTDKTSDNIDKLKYTSSKYLKEKLKEEYNGRYMALNLTNSNTIEFRFFNGVNNFEEFWGALQFIHNLVELARNEERDINTIKWTELMEGNELLNQAEKVGVLGIDKTAKDTSDILEKLEKAKEDTKEDIKKTLNNMIKYINKKMASKDLGSIKTNNITDIQNKSYDFINSLQHDLRYLENIIQIYNNISCYSVERIKENIIYIKLNLSNDMERKKYNRYFKQIENITKKYESEVVA